MKKSGLASPKKSSPTKARPASTMLQRESQREEELRLEE